MASPLPASWTVKVVGVTFVPKYPRNLHVLADVAAQATEAGRLEPLPVVLVRNPANAHDGNAIEVHVPSLGDYAMVGHLPRDVAARLAPELDAGARWEAAVVSVLIDPIHDDRPGISVMCKRRVPVAAAVAADPWAAI